MSAADLRVRIQQFFDEPGTPAPGWADSEEAAIQAALARYPTRPYCTVRSWRLLDIRLTDEERARVQALGMESRVLFADQVVTDSSRRFNPGDLVYTTMQRSYDPAGFFETRNTVYVLLGEGYRTEVDLDLYNALMRSASAGL